jgi:hypothetical protein
MSDMYILDEHGAPRREYDATVWGLWFERSSRDRSRIVAQDKDEAAGEGGTMVSTVFLGLDHNFGATGPPILWESMILGGPLDGRMRRYTSRDAALEGHAELCNAANAARGHT